MVLSKATLLNGRYAIQSVLGEVGPLDITYLAWDIKAEREVVIREYFPLRFARRATDDRALEVLDAKPFEYGLSLFGREGELLSEFKHPNVVGSFSQFRENDTLYRVSDHITGVSLYAHLKRHEGFLTEEESIKLIDPLLDGLARAHSHHLYHGGISPKSILIMAEGTPMLLNFQMARTRLAMRCGVTKEILAPGFYPAEILKAEGLAAWDIYACGALLFYLFTGHALPAFSMQEDYRHVLHSVQFDHLLSPDLRQVLQHSVAFSPADRPLSIASLQRQLKKTLVHNPALGQHKSSRGRSVEVGYAAPSDAPHQVLHDKQKQGRYHEINFVNEERAIPEQPGAPRPPAKQQSDLMQEPDYTSAKPPRENAPAIVPTHRDDYLPQPAEEKNPDFENLMFNLLRRQQYFVMSAVGAIVLILIAVGGFFLLPRLGSNNGDMLPPDAAAEETEYADAGPGPNAEQPSTQTTPPAMEREITEPLQESAGDEAADLPLDERRVDERPADEVPATAPPPAPAPPAVNSPAPRAASPSTTSSATPQEPGSPPPAGTATAPRSENSTNTAPDPDTALAAETEAVSARRQKEEDIRTLIMAGNGLYQDKQIREALNRYEATLALDPGNARLATRIDEINQQLASEAQALARAESLRIRLSKVTDKNGIFIAPDSPPVLLNEAQLAENIDYPPQARRAGIEGRVIVRLVVDPAGNVQNPEVVQGLGFGCDEEVIRLLSEARYEAATFNKEPVSAWTMYSLVFSLK